MTTPINSIKIPQQYIDLCNGWYAGVNYMLYAIASTGKVKVLETILVSHQLNEHIQVWHWCHPTVFFQTFEPPMSQVVVAPVI